ncbi:hypothetical protein ACFLU8_05530 [Chloroflexota bacterium]
MNSYLGAVVFAVLPTLIYVAAWIVAIAFAVRMVRGGGGKAERFLLIGVSLMLVSSVVASIWAALMPWVVLNLTEAGSDRTTIAIVSSIVNITRGCISLAGIVFLVYAYWQKFKTGPTPVVSD